MLCRSVLFRWVPGVLCLLVVVHVLLFHWHRRLGPAIVLHNKELLQVDTTAFSGTGVVPGPVDVRTANVRPDPVGAATNRNGPAKAKVVMKNSETSNTAFSADKSTVSDTVIAERDALWNEIIGEVDNGRLSETVDPANAATAVKSSDTSMMTKGALYELYRSSSSFFPKFGSSVPTDAWNFYRSELQEIPGRDVPELVVSMYPGGFRIPCSHLCRDQGRKTALFIVVITAPGNGQQRDAVRRTWGTIASLQNVSLAFLVGLANESITAQLFDEQARYRDIIQGNFVDCYRNLTLKTVAMLEWLYTFCPLAGRVLKVDDDVFLNVPNLLDFLRVHSGTSRTLFGRLAHGWRPFRTNNTKYYVTKHEFAGAVYPDFVTGPCYLLTGDLVSDLYWRALLSRFFFLEDIFLTGLVAKRVGAKLVAAKQFLNVPKKSPCAVKDNISVHKVDEESLVNFHEQLSSGKMAEDCKKVSKVVGKVVAGKFRSVKYSKVTKH